GDTLTVLTNDGSGNFVLASTLNVGTRPHSLAAADVNGDGKVDLISANSGDNTLSVLSNNVNGVTVNAGTTGDGANATNVSASNFASGTMADARLSANVALLTNPTNTFSGAVTASSFTGSGALAYQTVAGTTQSAAANTGYVLTNAAQTTVTLPTTASAGDLV